MSEVSANVRLYRSDGALCLYLDFNFFLYLYFGLYLMFSNLDLFEYVNVLEASADVRWWPCRQQSRRERAFLSLSSCRSLVGRGTGGTFRLQLFARVYVGALSS